MTEITYKEQRRIDAYAGDVRLARLYQKADGALLSLARDGAMVEVSADEASHVEIAQLAALRRAERDLAAKVEGKLGPVSEDELAIAAGLLEKFGIHVGAPELVKAPADGTTDNGEDSVLEDDVTPPASDAEAALVTSLSTPTA